MLLLPGAMAADDAFADAVAAYREGRYLEAEKTLQQAHHRNPENSNVTYYLAMTQAQLGRFKQARALYEEILKLDPNSQAAQYAEEGLQYLPDDTVLDHPPRFTTSKASSAKTSEAMLPADDDVPATPNGMSPQELMAWQMMMAQMGGNPQQGGLNPWMYLMQQPQGNNPNNSMPSIDPNVMSNLLMNQMMQNFSLEGSRPDNP